MTKIYDLSEMVAYKGIWTLDRINQKTKRKQSHFYVQCLVGGRVPIYAVYDLNMKLKAMVEARDGVRRLYPDYTWGRVMAAWSCLDTENHTVKERRGLIAEVTVPTTAAAAQKAEAQARKVEKINTASAKRKANLVKEKA